MCIFTIQAPANTETLRETAQWIIKETAQYQQALDDGAFVEFQLPEKIDGVTTPQALLSASGRDGNILYSTGTDHDHRDCSCASYTVIASTALNSETLAQDADGFHGIYANLENIIIRERHHRAAGHHI